MAARNDGSIKELPIRARGHRQYSVIRISASLHFA